MIIVDTNVVSELTRELPNGTVLRWMRTQSLKQLATTTVTLAELQLGIELLPIGQKRTVLSEKLAILLAKSFGDRILSFDESAVPHYARLGGLRKSSGRASGVADLMIAAIAASRGFSVCTRNVADFEFCGVALLNPWAA